MASNSPIFAESKKKVSHQPKDPMAQVTTQAKRIIKGYDMTTNVKFTTPNTGTVLSSDGTKEYHFILPDTCECPDNQIRQRICKHLIAAKAKQNEPKIPELPLENNLIDKSRLEETK